MLKLPFAGPRACVAALALALAPAAQAQDLVSTPAPLAFAVSGFEVRGDSPLPPDAVQALLAPFTGPQVTLARLQEAAAALEAALHARGHRLHHVVLPPQSIGERVVLEVVPVRLARVEVRGARHAGEDNVRRSLPELREGHAPNLHRLAAQTALANESPVRQVQVALSESDEPDRVDATVRVRDQRPWQLAVGLSNHGSDATGRERLTLVGRHANLGDRDLELLAAYTTAPARAGDVRQMGLSARWPWYDAGGLLAFTATRSDISGDFGAFTSRGAGRVLALAWTLPLPTGGQAQHHVSVGIEDRLFEAARIDGQPVAGLRDRRSRPLVVGYAGRSEAGQSQSQSLSRWGVEAAANTDTGQGNDLAAYQSENPRITTSRWRMLRASAHHQQAVARWTVTARAQAQHSAHALIAGEQFGLGGPTTVRGTRDERPLAGDGGLLLSLEVAAPPAAGGLQGVAFVDAGWLRNAPPRTAYFPASDRIASAGVGVRLRGEGVSLSVDYGRIIVGSRVDAAVNPQAPRAGHDRLYASLTFSF